MPFINAAMFKEVLSGAAHHIRDGLVSRRDAPCIDADFGQYLFRAPFEKLPLQVRVGELSFR